MNLKSETDCDTRRHPLQDFEMFSCQVGIKDQEQEISFPTLDPKRFSSIYDVTKQKNLRFSQCGWWKLHFVVQDKAKLLLF